MLASTANSALRRKRIKGYEILAQAVILPGAISTLLDSVNVVYTVALLTYQVRYVTILLYATVSSLGSLGRSCFSPEELVLQCILQRDSSRRVQR
jgi:hypothetical protein